MEHNINNLLLYTMEATDGLIGDVKDFYFDDKTWHVRYLIIKTGGWLSGREVLISPVALLNEKWRNGVFPVSLTKKQVNNSPDIDTDKPVSRQQESALYDHYAWEGYWFSGYYPGGYLGVSTPFPSIDQKVWIPADEDTKTEGDTHLRSTATITGYHIHAADAEIGHVIDFIIDDETWQIKFIVVDTHNWFGGKKVLIPTGLVKKIEWADAKVYLEIDTATVEKCEPFIEADYTKWQIATP